jgi:hypothetical protein
MIAKDGELPVLLERKIWNKPIEGLLITSGVTLVVANVVDLSSLSTMGSAGFLLIFAAVNAANARVAGETKSRRWLSLGGVGLCLAALGALLLQTALTEPRRIWILVGMIGAAFTIELAFRVTTGRAIRVFSTERS